MKLIIKSLDVRSTVQKLVQFLVLFVFFGVLHIVSSIYFFSYSAESEISDVQGIKQVSIFSDNMDEVNYKNLDHFETEHIELYRKIEVLGFSQSHQKFTIYSNENSKFRTLFGKPILELGDREIAVTFDTIHSSKEIVKKINKTLDLRGGEYTIKSIYYDPILSLKYFNFLSDYDYRSNSAKAEVAIIVNSKQFNLLKNFFNKGVQYQYIFRGKNLKETNKLFDAHIDKLNLVYKSDISGFQDVLESMSDYNAYFQNQLFIILLGFLIIIFSILLYQVNIYSKKIRREIEKLRLLKIDFYKINFAKKFIVVFPSIVTVTLLNSMIYVMNHFFIIESVYYVQITKFNLISLFIQIMFIIIISLLSYILISKKDRKNTNSLPTKLKIGYMFFMLRMLSIHRYKYLYLSILSSCVLMLNLIVCTMNSTLLKIKYPESFKYDYSVKVSYENFKKLKIKDYLLKDVVKTDQFIFYRCQNNQYCDENIFKVKVYAFSSSNYASFFEDRFKYYVEKNKSNIDINNSDIRQYLSSINAGNYETVTYQEIDNQLQEYYEIWTTKKIDNILNQNSFFTASYEVDIPMHIKKYRIFNIFDENMKVIYLFRKSNAYVEDMISKNPQGEALLYVTVENEIEFEMSAKNLGAQFWKYKLKDSYDTMEYKNNKIVQKINILLLIFDLLFVILFIIVNYIDFNNIIKQEQLKLLLIKKKKISLNRIHCINIILAGLFFLLSVFVIFILLRESVVDYVYEILKLLKENL